MDVTKTVEPRSDQLNFDDVQAHSITITVSEIRQGSPEQPVEIHNPEYPGRPYKPGKSMRRVLIAAWGVEASRWVGKKITIYGDPTIRFGKDAVGGIRISHLSHIEEPLTVPLTVTRGKRQPFTVQPLTGSAADPKHIKALMGAGTIDGLREAWEQVVEDGVASHPELIRLKDVRKQQLQGGA